MTDVPMLMTFKTITCCHEGCGLTFCVPAAWMEKRREDHTLWYCPNGHQQHFPGESDLEKERRARQRAEQQIAEAEDRVRSARARALHQERRASTFKGHCTRIKKKVQVGRCPCCDDTTFRNLRRHMLKHHPDWQPDAEPVPETQQA